MGFVSSVFGQLLFGYLADKYGRTRLYGIELVLVIVSTIGVATTSNGYGDISFLALFTWVCSFDVALYLDWLLLCSPPVADDNGSGGL
jgi:MFS family permease